MGQKQHLQIGSGLAQAISVYCAANASCSWCRSFPGITGFR